MDRSSKVTTELSKLPWSNYFLNLCLLAYKCDIKALLRTYILWNKHSTNIPRATPSLQNPSWIWVKQSSHTGTKKNNSKFDHEVSNTFHYYDHASHISCCSLSWQKCSNEWKLRRLLPWYMCRRANLWWRYNRCYQSMLLIRWRIYSLVLPLWVLFCGRMDRGGLDKQYLLQDLEFIHYLIDGGLWRMLLLQMWWSRNWRIA